MRNISKVTTGTITIALALGLMGCSAARSSNESIDGSEAKKELAIELKFLQNESKRLINKDGKIEDKTFQSYKNDFNLLSASINSTSKIKTQSNNELKKNISQLEKDVDALTEKEYVKSYKRFNSSKTIYEVTLMNNMHDMINATKDWDEVNNELALFDNIHMRSSEAHIKKDMGPAIDHINTLSKYKIELMQDEIQKHRDSFTKLQLQQLKKATHNFNLSLDNQIKSIQAYKPIGEDYSVSRDFSYKASEKYTNACIYITDFESNLGIAKAGDF
ncbi:hypothetical protein [Priestia megaterium]|uniref:hypothetical protein n=1 Tax=Priestia megaterium TaxID=1404 RepID=UPI001BEC2B1D|nr:hypothetical protein [Priestia megaterium]MBT2258600.1 hypothetical protein [Priestia megaterium]MBT2279793.1 hypothetical protein [Priestia megaterium]